ncbi:hypothetical protein WBP06_09640 [Novosphingobium sp. BL-8H]|uniref:hypothetical protein n=1 Tax=Novosphingobium sp. BL-8H TaxID=3127640 RepID=UPI00375668CD
MSPHDKAEQPLNPALRQTEEKKHTTGTTPAPIDSISAREGQGEGWPIVWFVVAIICVGVTIYFFV